MGALVEGRRSLDDLVFDMVTFSVGLLLLKTVLNLPEKLGDIKYGWRGIDVHKTVNNGWD